MLHNFKKTVQRSIRKKISNKNILIIWKNLLTNNANF